MPSARFGQRKRGGQGPRRASAGGIPVASPAGRAFTRTGPDRDRSLRGALGERSAAAAAAATAVLH
eukprot:7167883-Alexandrium_andersonii.AAC.1